ncbi:MAG: patatin-like phospholipase family protein [Pyrinomonadaceae bacterium]
MTTQFNPATDKLIVSCDGGGIRGLIVALLLQQIDSAQPNFLGQTYLHAGTSTGGIISLAMACGIDLGEIVSLYENDGSQIFTTSACLGNTNVAAKLAAAPDPNASGNSWWTYIIDHIMELLCVWYDNGGLKQAVVNTLGSSTATATLNSLVPAAPASPQYVLVNTLQLCDSNNTWVPLQLTNLPNLPNNNSGVTLVIDAAMSTSAAPMYFPPYQHPTYGYCADGGLFANNPGTIAITSLMASGIALENIWMLSISTGNTLDCYPPSIINTVGAGNFGPLFWIFPTSQPDPAVANQPYTPALPLMSAFFDGTSEIDDFQCAQLLGGQYGRYVRANIPLTTPIALDDYSSAAIQAMKTAVTNYAQPSSTSEWGLIQSWIKNNFG